MTFFANAYVRTMFCADCATFNYHEVVHMGYDSEENLHLFCKFCECQISQCLPAEEVVGLVEGATEQEWQNILHDHIPFNETN